MADIEVELICPYCRQKSRHDVDAGDSADEFLCKYPTDNGPCGRTVDNQTDYCWQHSDDND